MPAQKQLERVIFLATSLKESLEGLAESFQRLLPLIDREHAAIKSSQLNVLEQLTVEKETLGDVINQCSEDILKTNEELRKIYIEIVPEAAPKKGAGLADSLGWLRDIQKTAGEQGLGVQVLQHVEQKITRLHESLTQQKRESQMKIEMNKYLTTELLHRHRENIRLIQEMVAQANATYSPTGTTRTQEAKSVLQVKA